ncbi:hypothetical protein Ae201684P_019157 [Aphanomyces euteiches]|nr:hypothetical protein Ae201684P_019157 [Aphanomyces euteiches]
MISLFDIAPCVELWLLAWSNCCLINHVRRLTDPGNDVVSEVGREIVPQKKHFLPLAVKTVGKMVLQKFDGVTHSSTLILTSCHKRLPKPLRALKFSSTVARIFDLAVLSTNIKGCFTPELSARSIAVILSLDLPPHFTHTVLLPVLLNDLVDHINVFILNDLLHTLAKCCQDLNTIIKGSLAFTSTCAERQPMSSFESLDPVPTCSKFVVRESHIAGGFKSQDS